MVTLLTTYDASGRCSVYKFFETKIKLQNWPQLYIQKVKYVIALMKYFVT